ncbi:hypothetical protein ASPTUDRAFT_41342 [Aspergillus tubingensis CBS 134.48]|uniref:Uncharacterized protein n=1 Tax=Aspergillus tubingensis (strain CBS 134.48) TaxID=767770 RepID=A0A1L9N7J1_ASPTC|nr:hypothetical protein ASPTUDRAFT_41342 [Aspergillus tubingensis CBS 134.48]
MLYGSVTFYLLLSIPCIYLAVRLILLSKIRRSNKHPPRMPFHEKLQPQNAMSSTQRAESRHPQNNTTGKTIRSSSAC